MIEQLPQVLPDGNQQPLPSDEISPKEWAQLVRDGYVDDGELIPPAE